MKIVTKINPDHPEQRYQVTLFIGQDETVSFTEAAVKVARAVDKMKRNEANR